MIIVGDFITSWSYFIAEQEQPKTRIYFLRIDHQLNTFAQLISILLFAMEIILSSQKPLPLTMD